MWTRNIYYFLSLAIFLTIITVVLGAEDEYNNLIDTGDIPPEVSLEEEVANYPHLRFARGSAGTRQRYKNHPRPPKRKPQPRQRYYNGRAYQSNEYNNGYAAILG